MEIEVSLNDIYWVCRLMENDEIVEPTDLVSRGYLKTIYKNNIPMIRRLRFTSTEQYGKSCKEYWIKTSSKEDLQECYITKTYLRKLYKKE